MQLEGLADDVEEVLLDDALGREVLGEAADRGDLGHWGRCPAILANRGWWPARGPSSWPGSARAARASCPGSGSTTSRSERFIAAGSPPGRSVRPIDPANSTSPLSIVRSTSTWSAIPSGTRRRANITEPSVCPGACSTSNSSPASVSGCRSPISTTLLGSVQVALRAELLLEHRRAARG